MIFSLIDFFEVKFMPILLSPPKLPPLSSAPVSKKFHWPLEGKSLDELLDIRNSLKSSSLPLEELDEILFLYSIDFDPCSD